MPIMNCMLHGEPGFKWGYKGKCYTYDPNDEGSKEDARKKARKQGKAIKARSKG